MFRFVHSTFVNAQTEPKIDERRKSQRFRLVLPVLFEDTTGWTRDMSGNGVFFTYRDRGEPPLKVGEPSRLAIVVDRGDPRGGPMVVRCEGTIIRVEPTPHFVGVAVAFDTYQLDLPFAHHGHESELGGGVALKRRNLIRPGTR